MMGTTLSAGRADKDLAAIADLTSRASEISANVLRWEAAAVEVRDLLDKWQARANAVDEKLQQTANANVVALAKALEERQRELDDYAAKRRAEADAVVADANSEAERIRTELAIEREIIDGQAQEAAEKQAAAEVRMREREGRVTRREQWVLHRERVCEVREEKLAAIRERMKGFVDDT